MRQLREHGVLDPAATQRVVAEAGPDAIIHQATVGDGSGMMSFVHLDDAAAAAVLALDHDGPAIYNVTDDEPAATRDWLPALAAVVGARPPPHIPAWLGRLIMGEGLDMMASARGASNARARQELGWTLRYPSWRQGFRASYAPQDEP